MSVNSEDLQPGDAGVGHEDGTRSQFKITESSHKAESSAASSTEFTFSNDISMEDLRRMNEQFTRERNWHQFHSPRNVLLDLVGEVGELTEIFRFTGEVSEGLPELTPAQRQHTGEELADIMMCILGLASRCRVDLPKVVEEKMAANAKKYPVDKAYGKANKYTDYQ